MQQTNPAMPANGGLLNKNWNYVSAAQTDIRERFARVRAAQLSGGLPVRHPADHLVKKVAQ